MTFQTLEKNGGRIEKRICRAASAVEWPMDLPLWAGLKTIFSVTITTTIKGKTTEEIRYYISSLECNSENLLAASRSHWKVESNALSALLNDEIFLKVIGSL